MKRSSAGMIAALGVITGMGYVVCSFALSFRKKQRPKALLNKIVLITGASRGLGLALAEEFGRHGAKLVLAARDPEELQLAHTMLSKFLHCPYNDIFSVACDLRSVDEVERLFQAVKERLGRIDILVNNAGIITVGPLENQTVQDFRDVMDTNFFSGVHCTLAVLPEMLARRDGRIVNITSVGGKLAIPHLMPYSASKFAMVGFSEGLTAELRSKGIAVTTVCPGLMRTGSHLNAFFAGDVAREYRWFSLGASLPGISTSAAAAARKIVHAVIAGKREIAITPQAILASRLSNLMPSLTSALLQIVNSFLPSPTTSIRSLRRGAEVRDLELKSAVFLGTSAAIRYNQSKESTVSILRPSK